MVIPNHKHWKTTEQMIEVRPQPIGIYASSAAYLLLPKVDDDRGALKGLLDGDLNVPVPDSWQFFVRAAHGATNSAIALLADSDSPLAAYNRFALEPDSSQFRSLRRACQLSSGRCLMLLPTATASRIVSRGICHLMANCWLSHWHHKPLKPSRIKTTRALCGV